MIPILLLAGVFIPLLLFIVPAWLSLTLYRLLAQPPPEARFPDQGFFLFFNPRGPPLSPACSKIS
jgi:hypothetical protein